jgi:hypothetical protein
MTYADDDCMGRFSVVADPVTHQCRQSAASTCLACAILIALSLARVDGEGLNERSVAYDLGDVPGAGASMADAMRVLNARLAGTPWVVVPMPVAQAAISAVAAITIVAEPGARVGHAVTVFGLGDGSVRVHDPMRDESFVMAHDAVRAAFAGECLGLVRVDGVV